jgi:tetratricopeptide (TPR) repeat protein
LAWFYDKTGERYESMGRLDEAAASYQSALKAFPKDFHSMTGLARAALAQGRWEEAISRGEAASAIAPAPETLAIIGDANLRSGRPDVAKRRYALIDSIGRLAKSKGDTYDRQRALFLADHDRNLAEALEMAQSEMKVRRDVYSYDALAWALCKSGRLFEAQSAIRKALAYGTKDSRILYHASRIEEGLHNIAKSQEYRARMVQANPNLYVFGEPSKVALKYPFGGASLSR